MGSSCSTLTCCVALEHDDDGMPKKYVLHRTPSAITRRQERSAKRQQKRAAAAAAAKQLKGKSSPMSKSCSTSSSMMAGLSNDSSITITLHSSSAHQFDPVTLFSEGDDDDDDADDDNEADLDDDANQQSITPSTVVAHIGDDDDRHGGPSGAGETAKATNFIANTPKAVQKQQRSSIIQNTTRPAAATAKHSNNNATVSLVTFCATVAVLNDDSAHVVLQSDPGANSGRMYLQVGTGGGGGDENASASDATEFSDDRPFTPSTPTHTFQNVSNASFSSLGVALVGSSSNVQHRPLLPQNIPHRLQQARQTSLLTANVVGKFHHPR